MKWQENEEGYYTSDTDYSISVSVCEHTPNHKTEYYLVNPDGDHITWSYEKESLMEYAEELTKYAEGWAKGKERNQELQTRFDELCDIIYRETGMYSFDRPMKEHWAYQEIIGMERNAVIPMLLNRMYLNPSGRTGFVALSDIIKERPVLPKEYAGRVDKIKEMWFQWGKDNNYI